VWGPGNNFMDRLIEIRGKREKVLFRFQKNLPLNDHATKLLKKLVFLALAM